MPMTSRCGSATAPQTRLLSLDERFLRLRLVGAVGNEDADCYRSLGSCKAAIVSTYLVVKWAHILSSIVLLGTGFGSAYFMFFANRSRDVAAQTVVARLVVRADWWFTSPTVIIQPATGLWLAQMAGIPLSTPWLAASLVLFAVAGVCWIPVVWLQLRMLALANESSRSGMELPKIYLQYSICWERLGYLAFAAMLLVTYLMVVKPALST